MTFDARHGFAFAVLGATMLCAGPANAHFILTTPAADLEQDGLGDPQKESPCGGAGTETGMVTAYQAGDTVTITVSETVFHPGHFRVALALNDMSELPPEPEVTPDNNSACGTVDIMDPPVFPVLADGELLHTEQLPDGSTFDVVLPDDVECEACTLQVLMFMQEHGAPCFYHHCATISISPGAAEEGSSSVSGAETSSGGDDSSDGGSMTSNATTATTNDSTASAGDSGSDTGDTATGGSATMATTAGVTDSASSGDGDDDSGCGCTTDDPSPLAGMLALLGLVAIRRRR